MGSDDEKDELLNIWHQFIDKIEAEHLVSFGAYRDYEFEHW